MSLERSERKVRIGSRVIGLLGCVVALAGGCGGSGRSADGAGPDVREAGTSAVDGGDAGGDRPTAADGTSLDGAGDARDARDAEDAAADLATAGDGASFDGSGDAPGDDAADASDGDAADTSGPMVCTTRHGNDAGASQPDAAHGSLVEFPLPAVFGTPFFIAAGPDGQLWFSGATFDLFGTITTDGCVSASPALDYPGVPPAREITMGSDGNVWFCQDTTDQIGRIATDGSALREFALPAGTAPTAVTLGPDGNIWFAANGSSEIGRITPAGDVTSFPTPSGSPYDITSGPGGKLWFSARANSSSIGSIDPATGTILEFVVPDAGDALWIASGSDGNLWFINYRTTDGYFVTRVTPSQTFTDFPVGDGGFLMHIISGPDGNLWMAEQDANKIARLSPSTGVVTEYDVPTPNSQPSGMTVGPDGNIWFTEEHGNKIGRLTL